MRICKCKQYCIDDNKPSCCLTCFTNTGNHGPRCKRIYIKETQYNLTTYITEYGLISIYNNEFFIKKSFDNNYYWDKTTLKLLKSHIDSKKNILEIGGHCGTSSIVYASFISNYNKVYVFEPQKKMYNLLVKNIAQNKLRNKIIPVNRGCFCYNGEGKMNSTDLDGIKNTNVEEAYEKNNLCNFGGICLGNDGESVELVRIDDLKIYNIGFIHCDAQGSENFIFHGGKELIKKYRPVIFYENNMEYDKKLYDNVVNAYPEYKEESLFDIKDYCMNVLKYKKCIDKYNNGIDSLLLP